MVTERFYQAGGTVRTWMTGLWSAVFLFWLFSIFYPPHRANWQGIVWVVLAVVNVSSLWLNYWTVSPEGIDQHAVMRTKHYLPELLQYAGAPRTRTMQRWGGKTTELQVAGYADVRYARVHDREAFLEALRAVAPQADFGP